MKHHPQPRLIGSCIRPALLALVTAFALLGSPHRATAQTLMLANPHWNITLSDFGYSDFLLDNTPGFEGREYLSGEWGAAVGYQVAGRPAVPPEWLEPQFLFPDWTTRSPQWKQSAGLPPARPDASRPPAVAVRSLAVPPSADASVLVRLTGQSIGAFAIGGFAAFGMN